MNSKNNDKDDLAELAKKWLNGTLSSSESTFFEIWYKSFNDEEVKISDSNFSLNEDLRTHLLKKINSKIEKNEKPIQKNIYLNWKVAAAAVVLITAGALVSKNLLFNSYKPSHYIQVVTLPSQHKHLKLSDGTEVWLSPASVLTYPEKFNGNKREVSIDGEAFFEVKHDEKKTFIIQSESLKTTVLGTSFNINAYKKRPTIAVTVISGKVGIVPDKNKASVQLMVANETATYDKKNFTVVKHTSKNASKFLLNRKGLFKYEGDSLSIVLKDLEDQYNINLQVDSKYLSKAFYGSLNTNEQLNKTLNKLCKVMEMGWEKNGNNYKIK